MNKDISLILTWSVVGIFALVMFPLAPTLATVVGGMAAGIILYCAVEFICDKIGR